MNTALIISSVCCASSAFTCIVLYVIRLRIMKHQAAINMFKLFLANQGFSWLEKNYPKIMKELNAAMEEKFGK